MFKVLDRFKLLFITFVLAQLGAVVVLFNIKTIEYEHIPFFAGLILVNFMILALFQIIVAREAKRNYISTKGVLSFDAHEAFAFAETGIISYDEHYYITWVSEFLAERGFSNLIGKKIFDWKQDLKLLWNRPDGVVKVSVFGRVYSARFIKETRSFIFKDITTYDTLYSTYVSEAKVFGLLYVDNYQDVVQSSNEDVKIKLTTLIGDTISKFSNKHKALVKSSGPDSYVIIMDYASFENAKNEGFPIFQQFREKSQIINPDISLSIGFSFGHAAIPRLVELASSAIELCTARGGDQIIIRAFGKPTEFIGGESEAKFKTSRVKIRSFARTINYEIENAKNIIVVGHQFGDFDAIAAGIGIVHLADSIGKDVKWVCDFPKLDKKAKASITSTIPDSFTNDFHVSPMEALKYVDKETLVIIVDTHIQKRIEQPKLLDHTRKVIVIDHHRRSEEGITSMIDSFIEPSASSTSEIITEIWDYTEKQFEKPKWIVDLLLTGIVLDTNHYRMRTASRTYEASATLQQWGAEPAVADELLKDTLEDVQVKSVITNTMEEIIEGVLIAYAPNDMRIQGSELAQVAQNLLQIQGTRGAIVIGMNIAEQVAVSIRSDGSINSQVLAEELGGGGHFTAAGAQMANSTIEEVRDNIINLIRTGKTNIEMDEN